MYSFSSYYSRILSPLYLSLLSVLGTVSVRITHGFSLLFICLCYLFYVQFQFVLLTDSLSSLSVSVICFRYSFSSYYSRILSPLYLSLLSVLCTVSVRITHGFSLLLYLSLLSVLGTVSVRITHGFSLLFICYLFYVSFSSYYSLILSLYLSLLSVLGTVSVRITHGFSLLFICLCYLFYVQFQFVLLTDSLSSLSVSVICFMYSFSSYYSRILSPLYLSLLSVLGTVSVRITHWFSLLFICLCYLFYVQFQFVLLTDSLSSLSVSVICFRYSFSSYYSRILSLLYLSLLSVLGTVSVRITHGFSLLFICLCYLFYVQFQFVLLTDSLSSLSVSVICFRYSFSSYYSRILSPLYLSLLSVLCTVSVRITHGFSLLFICLCYLF